MARDLPSDDDAPPSLREQTGDLLTNLQFVTYTTVVVLLLALGYLWPRMFITVPTGSHGVMYRYFAGGTVTDRVWGEGLHVIPPWDHLTLYESRLQQRSLHFDVLSDEGLNLGVTISVKFRPYVEMLGYLHRDIGPDYFERLIEPDIQAHVRRTFGNRAAHEIYASANDLLPELRRVPELARIADSPDMPETPYVHIQEIKLVDIELPQIVQAAIADKYRQEQLMLEYRYKLEREEQEAQRKRTEAGGIRDYNRIIGELSPDVLRWRDLDATVQLASSPNSKVLVLGGSAAGSSLLFNVGGGESTPPPAPSAANVAPSVAAEKVDPAKPAPAKPEATKTSPPQVQPAPPTPR